MSSAHSAFFGEKSVKKSIRLALLPPALCLSLGAFAATNPSTPITHVVVLFQENVSFDHYFGTYPNAQNNPGETPFSAAPLTPSVNGLSPELLKNNPNKTADQTTQANPMRLSPAQAYTCSQNHSYTPEQQAVDSGLMDLFPTFTGRTTSQGCAADGTTVLGYYDGNTVTAYWNYAQNFALNDNSFGSTFGPSTTGALNMISGQTYGGVLHFGTGSAGNAFPNVVGSTITDIGDFDAYLDDCGNDKGGTVTTTSTLQMTGKNIGDLLNAAGLTWGWFQGGFAPTQAATSTTPAVCGSTHVSHPGVPNPVAPLLTGPDVHTAQADYVSHHEPFMMYASTANPHHLRPTSVAAIGTAADQANHQYDASDFFAALSAGNLPAVSFIKAPSYENGHPGNSDPIAEQNWVTSAVNKIMASSAWPNTAIIIAYDDSDGWYDHVNGPLVSTSNTTADALAGASNCGKPQSGANPARCGHGPRLPVLVISPWAVPNYVDHTLTDQTSIINFIETNWNLGFIDGATAPANGQASFDRNAGTLANMFNFNAPPNPAPLYLNCNGTYATTAPASCP
jgi:phospholipase C